MKKFNISISIVILKVLFFIYLTSIIAFPAAIAWELFGLPYYTSPLINITPFDWTCLIYGSIGIVATLISVWTSNDASFLDATGKYDGFPNVPIFIGSCTMLSIGIIRLLIQLTLLKF